MKAMKRTLVSILFALTLVAWAPPSQAQTPPSLPLGCWSFNGNGTLGTLCIPSLQADGSFVGTIMFTGYSNAIAGLWSSGAQQITFLRIGVATNLFSYQSYTGFLFPADAANPTGPQVLAGSFSVYGSSGGSMQARNFYGWTASHQ